MHKNSENDGALNPYIFHMHIIKRIKAIYFFFKLSHNKFLIST